MPDDADLIEQSELDIWEIVFKMRQGGVRFSIVHGIFQEMIKTLETQEYCQDWLTQCPHESHSEGCYTAPNVE